MKRVCIGEKAEWGHREDELDPEKDLYWFMSHITDFNLGDLKSWCRFFEKKGVPYKVIRREMEGIKTDRKKNVYFLLKNRVVNEDGDTIER